MCVQITTGTKPTFDELQWFKNASDGGAGDSAAAAVSAASLPLVLACAPAAECTARCPCRALLASSQRRLPLVTPWLLSVALCVAWRAQ